MTTEILRNLLSKPIWTSPSESTLLSSDPVMDEVPTGSDIHSPADSFVAENARLSYVVFDEAHYINDRSRGNVYEECIMKLPNQVQMIFLSATMSNPGHFKKWVEQIKPDRPVGVSQTTHRPVPLRFHMFVPQPQSFEECLPWSEAIAEGHLRVILDGEHGEILCDVYADMVKRYRQIVTFKTVKVKPGKDDPCDDLGDEIGAGQVVVTKQVRRLVPLHMLGMLNKLINFLAINEQLPAIFFTLSRKKCNVLANQVESNLITHIERRAVEDTFNHYIRALEDYNQYRQVNELRVLLFKGVGVHHSGMLTILKEIVEVLFTKGLIKVMFATETLAIGVNTPTRVTCFTDVLKYDGYSSCKRVLTVEEFKQMAGRAGRRGLDTVGEGAAHLLAVIQCTMLTDTDTDSLLTVMSNEWYRQRHLLSRERAVAACRDAVDAAGLSAGTIIQLRSDHAVCPAPTQVHRAMLPRLFKGCHEEEPEVVGDAVGASRQLLPC
jgi:superfamily II RNA helicase